MNRKLIISLSTIAAIAIIVIGATTAYFSNTETSTGNTFIAGAIDLKIDNECHLNGRVCADGYWQGTDEPCDCTWGLSDLDGKAIFNFTDVKPGDDGEDTISLHVDSNPAWICAEISNIQQFENGCNVPEGKVDTTCDNPGLGQGELWENLSFDIWMDNGAGEHECNNIKDDDETYLVENAKATNLKWPIADSETGGEPIRDACIGVAWSVPDGVGNIIQGDSVIGDIIFYAYQSRHNENFVCYPPELYCGDGIVSEGEECDGDEPKACTTAEGYAGEQVCASCAWSECRPTEWCGDNILNDAEQCDGTIFAPPYDNGNYTCDTSCLAVYVPSCGNSIIDPNEQCDDGNNTPLDGCSATCTLEPTITIVKIVENNGVGTKVPGDFRMTIDGTNAAQDTAIYVSAGAHTISEADTLGYDKTYSEECPAGAVDLGDDEDVTCTVTNTMPYGTITVTKTVTNDNGGNKVVGDFTLKIDGITVTSGVAKNVSVGTHTVSEDGQFGYSATISGYCSSAGLVTVGAGENKDCTITNDDIAPSIELVKVVNGGGADPDDFDLSINGSIVTSGSSNPVMANTAHVLDEEVIVPGYDFISMTGTSFKGVSCPSTLGGIISLIPGDVVTCTITNTY